MMVNLCIIQKYPEMKDTLGSIWVLPGLTPGLNAPQCWLLIALWWWILAACISRSFWVFFLKGGGGRMRGMSQKAHPLLLQLVLLLLLLQLLLLSPGGRVVSTYGCWVEVAAFLSKTFSSSNSDFAISTFALLRKLNLGASILISLLLEFWKRRLVGVEAEDAFTDSSILPSADPWPPSPPMVLHELP